MVDFTANCYGKSPQIKIIHYFYGMIVYNDTYIVEDATAPAWLKYMTETHIPAIMATGCFTSHKLLTVIDSPNEGVTFCVQFNADTIERFNDYYNNHLYTFQQMHEQRFAERFVIFNTLMKTIE